MKASSVLAGLLVLFLLIHGLDNSLFVTCAKNWLQVTVRRTPFVDELLPQVHELFLGNGCPVTTELPDSFEFLYGLTTCGIRTHESSWGILIESSVTYESLFLNRGGVIPVVCFVKRNDPFTFGEEDLESDNETSGENSKGQADRKTQHHLKHNSWSPIQEYHLRTVLLLLDYVIFLTLWF